MKLKSLLIGLGHRNRLQGRRQDGPVVLDKKECTYSYFADPMYVFMDAEYNQYEVEAENMGDALHYLEDGMPGEVVFYDGKAISVETADHARARNHLDRAGRQGRHLGQGAQDREDRHRLRDLQVPLFVQDRRQGRNRHPHRRVPQPRVSAAGRRGHCSDASEKGAPRGAFLLREIFAVFRQTLPACLEIGRSGSPAFNAQRVLSKGT